MEKDITTKDLIANNDVFADIANVNIFAGETVITANDLETVLTDTSYKDVEGKHHKLFRDILKRVDGLGGCLAFLGYENQTDINNVMPVRDMGYTFTSYMEQIKQMIAENRMHKRHAYSKVLHDNQKLIPVATVVLYFGTERWERPMSLLDILDIPKEKHAVWSALVNDYKIHVIHMANQPKEVREKYQSDFGIIADYLAYQGNAKELDRYLRRDTRKLVHVEQVLDLLKALSGDLRFGQMKEWYLESDEKEECDNMCVLLDLCEERGIKAGIEQGLQAGIEQGLQAGIEQGREQGIAMATKIIRLSLSGKTAEEIAEEMDEEITVITRILEM